MGIENWISGKKLAKQRNIMTIDKVLSVCIKLHKLSFGTKIDDLDLEWLFEMNYTKAIISQMVKWCSRQRKRLFLYKKSESLNSEHVTVVIYQSLGRK